MESGAHPFTDRVAVLGFPDSTTRYHAHAPAPWSRETLRKVKRLGFTAVQLNLAWGARPDDDPLNLEDVVELDPAEAARLPQVVPLNCKPGSEARERRRRNLRDRLGLATAEGMRTIFHFGAPYNAHARYGDGPPNCLLDPAVHQRYEGLLRAFARDFPGVDDLWVYTYDQDAWLCSEFGPCPRCLGVPLHERLVPFLDRLRQTWLEINPSGRVWWEPWELSAGQVYACLERLPDRGMGFAAHANIAESMSAVATDRWLENAAEIARQRGVPVTVEWFLGGLSEEVEPLSRLTHPVLIWRGLSRIAGLPGVGGIKEYYGILPDREDPNLRMTSIFLAEPSLSEADALRQLARPYGAAGPAVIRFWQAASVAMARYPWDLSWMARQVGRSATDHSLHAAIIRPMLCPTPSWQSTRGTVFIRTEDTDSHPWLLEDAQLRFQQAAACWSAAVRLAEEAGPAVPPELKPDLRACRDDTDRIRRRALAYSCHLRATCISLSLRRRQQQGLPLPPSSLKELDAVLRESRANHAEECAASAPVGRGSVAGTAWPEMDQALADLARDPREFLGRWLTAQPDRASRGTFSLTSV